MEQLHSLLYRFPQFFFPFRQSHPPFPLFRLPLVAYKNVIDLMTSCEQFSLSLCSRKANSIVKNIRHRPKSLELWVIGVNHVGVATGYFETIISERLCYSVIKSTKTSPDSDPVEAVMIRGNIVPAQINMTQSGNHHLETYWDDEDFGLRMITDYVCDLFRVNIFSMMIRKDYRKMSYWLRKRQSFVNMLEIRGKPRIGYKEFKNVLWNNNSEILIIDASVSKHFRLRNYIKKVRFVQFCNCSWITMEDLMRVDVPRIDVLSGKMFTNQDVNRFLKHWMKGGSPRLKQIRLILEDWDEEVFLEGINVQDGTPAELFYTGYFYGFEFDIDHAKYIVREDETKASFGFNDDIFFFVVWPDSIGRTFESFH
uniref:F-box domain-containing protein n=1 Tax=Caenorhabditis tropicalis TaxID=1561998 RepID=A0A1I7UVX4_9PELO